MATVRLLSSSLTLPSSSPTTSSLLWRSGPRWHSSVSFAAFAASAAAARTTPRPTPPTPTPSKQQQRRWAAVHDVVAAPGAGVRRFLSAERRVEDAYRAKLERKARAEGHADVAQLRAAYAERIAERRRADNAGEGIPGLEELLADAEPPSSATAAAAPANAAPGQADASSSSSTAAEQQAAQTRPGGSSRYNPSSSPSPPSSSAAVRPLSAILDLPRARALPLADLTAAWRQLHASASARSLCAVVPAATAAALEAAARQCPRFVLPVPRPGSGGSDGNEGGGAEIHLLQWVFDAPSATSTVLFTQLAEFKARGEYAQPHTSITHYWDRGSSASGSSSGSGSAGVEDAVGLSDPAGPGQDGGGGIVLMAGHVVEGRGASVADAQWLVMLLQRFYAGREPAKTALLRQFAAGDPAFSVDSLLEESERLG
ncbi:ATP11 protein-domain-containing protein [Xylariaceae sp. FL0804]|nr:ATP11 protein-domain-containing protein [Xylariaceae sp. FL0804]